MLNCAISDIAAIEVRVTKAGDRPNENFEPEKTRRVVERVVQGGPLTGRDAVEVALRIEMELIDTGRNTVTSGQVAAGVHRLLEDPRKRARKRASRISRNFTDRSSRRSRHAAGSPPSLARSSRTAFPCPWRTAYLN